MQRTALRAAADAERVCRAWHVAYGVRVPVPGFRGAEGKEKGKDVAVRRSLKEAQSEHAGRRTGTGYEVWYARGERARDREALHPQRGVLYKSGVYAWKAACLTPGGLHSVRLSDWVGSDPRRSLCRSQQRA